MGNTRINEECRMAFARKCGEASALAQEIADFMEDHMGTSPDEIDWSHVGSAEKVIEDLRVIAQFIGLERDEVSR